MLDDDNRFALEDFSFSFRPKQYAIALSSGFILKGSEESQIADAVVHLFDQLPRTDQKSELFEKALRGDSEGGFFVVQGRPDGTCIIYRHRPGFKTKSEPVCPRLAVAYLQVSLRM